MATGHPKVLFVTGEYPPMVGGVGRFTAELAAALQAQGAQVAVLTDEQVTASSESDAVRVLPGRRSWGWGILSEIHACARAVGAEWVHVQYQTAAYRMHPAINALPYFLRRQGLRAAWTYHDLRIPYLFPKAGARLRNWVTRLPLRAADAVVVTNQSDWEAVQGQVQRGQLHRIPIGNDIKSRQFTTEERIERRAARGYGSGQLVLGTSAFSTPAKAG